MAISFEEFAKVGLERGLSREEITAAYEKEFNVKFQPTPKQEDVDTLSPPDEDKEVKPPIVIGGQLISKPQQYPSMTTPMLRSLDDVRGSINPDSLEMALAAGDSEDNYLASVAVSKFFFERTGIAPQDSLRVGRAMLELPEGSYKDLYDSLHSGLNHPTYLKDDKKISRQEYLSSQQEIAKQQLGQTATTIDPTPSFTLKQRPPTKEESLSRFDEIAERAKWRQYDIPDNAAKQLESLYKNDAIDTAIYYGGMAPRALIKAVGNFAVNIGDKVSIPTPWTEGLIEEMTSFERSYMNDYLLAGQKTPFMWAAGTQNASDLAGNIWLMAQGMKSFSAATGKQLSFLKMPATTAAEYRKGIFGRSLFLATAAALNTKGGFEKTTVAGVPVYLPTQEQMNTFGLVMSYANTGIISSGAPNKALTYLTDLAMNVGISASWSVEKQEFTAGGQFADAFEIGGMYADELGLTKPEVSLGESLKNLFGQYGSEKQRQAQRDVAQYAARLQVQMSQAIPIIGADIFFSAMVRNTSGSGSRAFFDAQSKPVQFFREADKVDEGASARYIETLRSAYGDLWRDSMTRGEGTKLANLMFMEQGLYAKPVDSAIQSRYPVPKAYQPATGPLRDVKSNNPVTINNLPPLGTKIQNEKLLEKINVRLRPDGKLQLTHFSPKEGLEVIDPELAGTGPLMGRERFRGGVNKSYFGIEGYKKESGLGDNRYITSVDLDKLYPAYDNPLGFSKGDLSEYETAIKNAGFQGYIVEGDPRFGSAVIMFDSLPVESSFKDNVTVATSGNFTFQKLDDFVATNIEEVKALPLSVEGGETYNLNGTRYNDGGVTIPFASFKVEGESMISKDALTADNVLKFIQSNDDAIVSDLVKAGIYKPATEPTSEVEPTPVAKQLLSEKEMREAGSTQRTVPEGIMDEVTTGEVRISNILSPRGFNGNMIEDALMHFGDLAHRAGVAIRDNGLQANDYTFKLDKERDGQLHITDQVLSDSASRAIEPLIEKYITAHKLYNRPVTEMGQMGKDIAILYAETLYPDRTLKALGTTRAKKIQQFKDLVAKARTWGEMSYQNYRVFAAPIGTKLEDVPTTGLVKGEPTPVDEPTPVAREGEQKYSIDLNMVVPKQYKDVGVRFAKKAGQKSVYDLDKNEEILTGEDGTNVRDFSVDELKTIQTSLSKGKMPPVFVEEIKPSSMQIKAEQISKAMENLEQIMRSDKRTEVITTDAELKEFAPDKGKTKVKKGDIIPRKPKVSKVVTEYAELKKSLQYLAASSKKSSKTIKEETKAAEKIKADIRVEKQKDRLDALKIKQRKLKEQQKQKEKARKEETQRIKVEAKDRAMNIVKGLTTNTQIIREYEKQSKAIGTSDKKFLKFINKAYTEIPKLLDQQVRDQASAIISKKIPDVDFEYIKAADEIKSSISMNTSDKMIAKYEASLRYMEEHPDAQLPQSYIKKLRKTPVQNLSTKDLVALANEKERLVQLGKTKLRLRNKQFNDEVNQRLLEIKENYKFLSETIRGANPSDPFVNEFYTFEESIVKGTKVRKPTLKLEALRPQRFFDMLDGGRAKFDGPMYNTFVVEPNRAYADMVEMRSARYESYNLLLQDLNESSKTLGARVNIDGVKYERRQLAGAYAISKNRIGRAALINGNFKNISDAESHLAKILNHVETDIHLKQIADYLLYDFQYNQNRVEQTLGLTENKILTIEENYFSLERRDIPMESSKDFMDMLIKTSDYTEKLPNDKFVLDRQENDGFQSPVNLNIDYVWTRQTAMQEHYIAHAGLAKSLNKIKSDRVLRGTIESEFGDKALRYLDRQVELINNPNSVYKSQSDLELISRQLRGNFAGSALGLNFKTILKQMPSVNYYLGETTPAHLIAAIDQATLAFRKDGSNAVLDFVAKKDPIILESVIARELIEMKKTSPDKYNRYINKIGELGFKGIVEVDRFVRSTGWMAVYNKKIEDGFSEQAAIDAARNATLRTQPTARAADLPLMYTTDEFLNWSLMFSNQLNQMWNMQTYDIPRRLGNVSTFIPAIQQQTGLALSAMTMWQINNGRVLPDEKEDLLKEVFADQFFAQIPLIGGPILQGYKGYSFDQPIISTFEDAGKIMFKLADGQEVTSEEYFNAFLFGVAPFTGLPTVFGRRAYNVIMESSSVLEGVKEITGIKEPKK